MDNLKLHCITWNVETSWPEQNLQPLLSLDGNDDHPDIYIICLQEVRSQPQNFLMDSLFEEPWTTAFRETLGPFGYIRITGERLQGIVSSIFVKRHHLPHLRDIHTAVTRTGLGGFWGNKGGVSVRFCLYGCSICIVNSHLAAHDTGYDERSTNYNAIIDQTTFTVQQTSRILYHDYVFWLGDLNYRLTGQDTPEAISKMIQAKNLDTLMKKDELRKAQATGDAFGPLVEGSLSFAPTYKYLTNSTDYDLSRRPAWTDRILHQVHVDAYENVKLGVTQTSYESKLIYGQSDHKPVVAGYSVKVFANYTEKCVTFKAIKGWLIGDSHKIRYTLDADVFTSPWDYIAMFKSNFTSVHQYVTYSYVPQILDPQIINTNESVGTASKSVATIRTGKTFELVFNDELVQSPGLYVLLYYSAKYTSYLGMSDPFPVTEKF